MKSSLFAERILVAYILNMELTQEENGEGDSIEVKGRHWLVWLVGIVAVGDAFRLRWLSDDAFISFRYAHNVVDGHGLVFNSGEYVEGYTNLLWTLLMAFGMIHIETMYFLDD